MPQTWPLRFYLGSAAYAVSGLNKAYFTAPRLSRPPNTSPKWQERTTSSHLEKIVKPFIASILFGNILNRRQSLNSQVDRSTLTMPKGAKRGREEAESYDSDGGFVENDSEDGAPKKKTKRTAAPTKTHDDGDEKYWEVIYIFKLS